MMLLTMKQFCIWIFLLKLIMLRWRMILMTLTKIEFYSWRWRRSGIDLNVNPDAVLTVDYSRRWWRQLMLRVGPYISRRRDWDALDAESTENQRFFVKEGFVQGRLWSRALDRLVEYKVAWSDDLQDELRSRYEDSYSTSRRTFRCCERIRPEEEI